MCPAEWFDRPSVQRQADQYECFYDEDNDRMYVFLAVEYDEDEALTALHKRDLQVQAHRILNTGDGEEEEERKRYQTQVCVLCVCILNF